MSTTLRSFTIIGFLLTTNLIQPASIMNFDYVAFDNYTRLTEDEFDNIRIQVQNNHYNNNASYDADTVWTNEKYPLYVKTLYQHQRKFLKALIAFVKEIRGDTFSEQLESEIYKRWKHNFKRNYKNSLATGNWDWSHDRFHFVTHEKFLNNEIPHPIARDSDTRPRCTPPYP